MRRKIIGIVAMLAISVCILSGCGTTLEGLGSTVDLDLQNSRLHLTFDTGLVGIETVNGDTNGTGALMVDIQLDWRNKDIHCKVDTDSSASGDGHLDFFLNWAKRDAFCFVDSKYPASEAEKASGEPILNDFHFDFLMDWEKRNLSTNLNLGRYDENAPLSGESTNEGVTEK